MTRPCDPHNVWTGRRLDEWCDECSHSVAVHKLNHVCSACEVVEQIQDAASTAVARKADQ